MSLGYYPGRGALVGPGLNAAAQDQVDQQAAELKVQGEHIAHVESVVTAEGVAVTTLQQQVSSLTAQQQSTANTANQAALTAFQAKAEADRAANRGCIIC